MKNIPKKAKVFLFCFWGLLLLILFFVFLKGAMQETGAAIICAIFSGASIGASFALFIMALFIAFD